MPIPASLNSDKARSILRIQAAYGTGGGGALCSVMDETLLLDILPRAIPSLLLSLVHICSVMDETLLLDILPRAIPSLLLSLVHICSVMDEMLLLDILPRAIPSLLLSLVLVSDGVEVEREGRGSVVPFCFTITLASRESNFPEVT